LARGFARSFATTGQLPQAVLAERMLATARENDELAEEREIEEGAAVGDDGVHWRSALDGALVEAVLGQAA
jgi:hypothetical protein